MFISVVPKLPGLGYRGRIIGIFQTTNLVMSNKRTISLYENNMPFNPSLQVVEKIKQLILEKIKNQNIAFAFIFSRFP